VGTKARILIVDDNAAIRRLLVEILTRAGHQVYQAADGAEALVWRDVGLDLVIVDLFMPDKDGVETILEFRASVPGIAIIAISGGGAGGSRLDLLKDAELLGAAVSIEKPFTPAELLKAVDQALRGSAPGPT
jgi:DNA-binding response OmpR family regulator